MDDLEYHFVEEMRAGRLSRREFLRRAGVLGLSVPAIGAILAACGGGSSPGSSKTTASTKAGSASTGSASTGSGGGGSAGTPKKGGTAKIGTTAPAADVDPVTMYNAGAIFTAQIPLEYLCFPRPDYSLDPRLATKWTAKSPSVWEFEIRQGVKWQDGKPFTVEDVVYTMNLLTNPKSKSAALSAFKGVLSEGNVEKVDSKTVRFHLDKAFVDFPYLVSAFNYNSLILPQGYQEGDFVKGKVGTGPFIMTKYSTQTGASFVRNPNYWDTTYPYLDGVEMKYYANTQPIVLAMQAGAIDVYPGTPYQGSQVLLDNPKITVLAWESSQYRTLQMRTDQPPWSDAKVRQALAYTLDREGIVKGVLGGYGQLGNDHAFAPVYPTSKLAIQEVPQRKQDVQKAKQLLSQAGHPRGFKATLTTENYLEIPQYADFVKQMASKAGIDINLKIETQTNYYGSGNNEPWLQVPLGITDWAARGSPSQTILPAYLCHGIWNSAHWCDPSFDKVVAEFDATLDNQKRLKLAAQAAKIQHDAVPDVIAYWIKGLRTVQHDIHGLAKGPSFLLDVRPIWKA